MTTAQIGKPVSRVDGLAKVTGTAKYAAEPAIENLAHGYVISSAIAKGKITQIDASEALALEGVVQVFSHENVPSLAWFDFSYKDMDAPPGSPFRPFHSSEVKFSMQPVALVVAETFELARYAASLVKISYDTAQTITNLEENLHQAYEPRKTKLGFKSPKSRGTFTEAFKQADTTIEATYFHGAEHHNPMELHASTVKYEPGGMLTVFDKTQGVINSWHYISMVFGLPKKKVRVLSPFVGGAFGSALRPQYQLFMAVLAALALKRSVKVVLTRQQMFSFGHRPVTWQQVALGASADGKLQAIKHAAIAETSKFEDYVELVVNWSSILYKCANVELAYKVVALDTYTPLDMRAPGGATGVFALECAMDELAYKLKLDPLELRLKNYTEIDESKGKPFSSKALLECYRQAAEKFGWSKRNPEPRSMRDGKELVGWGMATGIWDALHMPARAKAILTADGKLKVTSATADIGTGTYTIMTQIAADTLGLTLEDVTFDLGDSDMPLALIEGGSATAASVGNAVKRACDKVKESLLKWSRKLPGSPFGVASLEEVIFENGQLLLKSDPAQSIALKEIMRQRGLTKIEETATFFPNMLKQYNYALNTHSAVFVEVKVDEDLGTIKVTRVVNAVAAGKILNPKTARSQILGGVVWGIGMAMQEDTFLDHTFGRFMNHNLAEYHVPINADIHEIDVIFVKEEDEVINAIGVKGVGEIGLVGVASAIANAVYHATGKRVRDLPITLDKVL